MNFIDLFSGAGGLSEGFIKAGYNPIAHVEIDSNACKTLETRLVYHKLKKEGRIDIYHDYLSGKINRRDFISEFGNLDIVKSIINSKIGSNKNIDIFEKIDELSLNKGIDLIIGGPPCQAYSLVGRARDIDGMINDSRNYLYKDYAKFLLRYQPKIFVFENVLGLLSAQNGSYFKNMKSYFKRVGYKVEYSIQNSKNFGVLQTRKRIILIGSRKDIDFNYPKFEFIENKFKVNDILEDLKYLMPGEANNTSNYVRETNDYLKRFEIRNGVDFVTQHIARTHNERDIEIYKIAIEYWQNGKRLKYTDLPKRLRSHKNEKSFLDRFKVVDSNNLSHTMLAHIAKDGNYYIYPDINQIRSLSVREAARIQSFPDDYYFEGSRSSAFKQIGNAVPPLMSYGIANGIKAQLK